MNYSQRVVNALESHKSGCTTKNAARAHNVQGRYVTFLGEVHSRRPDLYQSVVSGEMNHVTAHRTMTSLEGTASFMHRYIQIPADTSVNITVRPESCVYFLRDASGNVKIGYTTGTAEKRCAQHRTSNPSVSVIAEIPGGTRGIEKYLHKRFATYKVNGAREWFSPGDSLVAFIDGLNFLAENGLTK